MNRLETAFAFWQYAVLGSLVLQLHITCRLWLEELPDTQGKMQLFYNVFLNPASRLLIVLQSIIAQCFVPEDALLLVGHVTTSLPLSVVRLIVSYCLLFFFVTRKEGSL